jgi:hypothetical protein
LQGSGAARLFDQMEEARQGCGKQVVDIRPVRE